MRNRFITKIFLIGLFVFGQSAQAFDWQTFEYKGAIENIGIGVVVAGALNLYNRYKTSSLSNASKEVAKFVRQTLEEKNLPFDRNIVVKITLDSDFFPGIDYAFGIIKLHAWVHADIQELILLQKKLTSVGNEQEIKSVCARLDMYKQIIEHVYGNKKEEKKMIIMTLAIAASAYFVRMWHPVYKDYKDYKKLYGDGKSPLGMVKKKFDAMWNDFFQTKSDTEKPLDVFGVK